MMPFQSNKDERLRHPTPDDEININALTTTKLHAENAKRVSGEFYRYRPSMVTDANGKLRFWGNTKMPDDVGSGG
jgi:hypothetical protein